MRRSNDEKSERVDDSELCLLSRRDIALPTRAHCLWDRQAFAHVSKQFSIANIPLVTLHTALYFRPCLAHDLHRTRRTHHNGVLNWNSWSNKCLLSWLSNLRAFMYCEVCENVWWKEQLYTIILDWIQSVYSCRIVTLGLAVSLEVRTALAATRETKSVLSYLCLSVCTCSADVWPSFRVKTCTFSQWCRH